jgi:Uma2 family endonuclease
MSTAASLAPPPVAPAAPPRAVRVWINEDIPIPAEVVDHESYRRWARSDDFPQRGRFAFLNGLLWVDLSMEKLYSHNRVKTQYTVVLGGLADSTQQGIFFSDGTLLSHPGAGLSTEPDGLFVSYEALRSGRVRRIEAAAGTDYVELEGSPEMTLEVVSDTSVHKDTVDLPELYWRAGVSEYWLVDAREEAVAFTILKRGRKGYVAVRPQKSGWLKSTVFGRSFRLARGSDPLGGAQFTLEVRP